MTQMIAELRQALVSAGAPEEQAAAAAASVAPAGDLATKADVLAAVAASEARVEARMAAGEARLTWRLAAGLAPVYALLAYLAIRLA